MLFGIKELLGVALFLIVLAFVFQPVETSQKMGEVIHAFKAGIEEGIK